MNDQYAKTYEELGVACCKLADAIVAIDGVMLEGVPDIAARSALSVMVGGVSRKYPLSTLSSAKKKLLSQEGSISVNTNDADAMLRQTFSLLSKKRSDIGLIRIKTAMSETSKARRLLGKPLFDKLELLRSYLQTGRDSSGNRIELKGQKDVSVVEIASVLSNGLSLGSSDNNVLSHLIHSELLYTIQATIDFYREISSSNYGNYVHSMCVAAKDAIEGVQDDFYVSDYRCDPMMSGSSARRDRHYMIGASANITGKLGFSLSLADKGRGTFAEHLSRCVVHPTDPILIIEKLQELASLFMGMESDKNDYVVNDRGMVIEAYHRVAALPCNPEPFSEEYRRVSKDNGDVFDPQTLDQCIIYGNILRFTDIAEHLNAMVSGIPIIMNYCLMHRQS